MATKKAYTVEQENIIIDALADTSTYQDQEIAILELVELLGKTKRSVTAKASSLAKSGNIIFIKKPTTKKENKNIGSMVKDELVDMLAVCLGVQPDVLESLTKANKASLELILNAVSSPIYEEWLEEREQEQEQD